MLVHIKDIIKQAENDQYAVGAFNVYNLETAQAVIWAAERLNSPVILQTTEKAIEYAGIEAIVSLVKALAEKASIPAALHLDHGHSLKIIGKCLEMGYSSIMIDGSHLNYKKNAALAKKVVGIAGKKKAWVQAELGRLEGVEEWVRSSAGQAFLTEPDEASEFVKNTGIDAFAVAIGNYHGMAKITENKILRLDLNRLEKIDKIVHVPLVLHGASGFDAKQIKAAVARGIRIINIDSELRVAFAKALINFCEKEKRCFDPRGALDLARAEMGKIIEGKIKIFGSSGKA